MTDNKIQFLTDDQISGILQIVRTDYIEPQVKAKLQDIKNSDIFKAEYDKVKNSDNFQKEYTDAITTKENNLKLLTLLEQVKLINKNYVIAIEDSYYHGDCYKVSLDTVEESYTVEISCIESRIESRVFDNLNYNSYDQHIIHRIVDELHTRLQLTSPSDFQTIIDNIIKFINVDKYITIKD